MSDLSPAPVAIIDPPWEDVKPQVNSEAEFLEIASDFGNPLEIVREAISNSIDARAKNIAIAFTVEEVDGAATLVITIEDDGEGMTRDVLARDFWGLGYSTSRDDRTKKGPPPGAWRSRTQRGGREELCTFFAQFWCNEEKGYGGWVVGQAEICTRQL